MYKLQCVQRAVAVFIGHFDVTAGVEEVDGDVNGARVARPVQASVAFLVTDIRVTAHLHNVLDDLGVLVLGGPHKWRPTAVILMT